MSAFGGEQKLDLGSYGSVQVSDVDLLEKKNLAITFSKEKLKELRKAAEDGNWSWKIAGFCCGLAIIAAMSLSFLSHATSLNAASAVLDLYLVLFGVIICVLEYKEHIFTQVSTNYLVPSQESLALH
jgi:hypothetical protein